MPSLQPQGGGAFWGDADLSPLESPCALGSQAPLSVSQPSLQWHW